LRLKNETVIKQLSRKQKQLSYLPYRGEIFDNCLFILGNRKIQRKEVFDYMNQKKLELLRKIKKAHLVYQKCTEEQKARLDEAMKPTFFELEQYGMSWTVAWSLMVFGNDFYFAEIEKVKTPETAQVFELEAVSV
jgi:hypothetical protein